MPDAKDTNVIVAGAGIVGICAALYLLGRGFSDRVIDPDPPADGASSGNAGVISRWSSVPQSVPGLWKDVPRMLFDPEGPVAVRWTYMPRLLPWLVRFFKAGVRQRLPAIADAMLALNLPCIDLFRQLLEGTGHGDLVRDSLYLHVYRNPAGADLESLPWRLRRDRGVPFEVLTGSEIREIEPSLSPEYKAGVAIKSQARAINPGRLGKVLAAKAEAQGAGFLLQRPQLPLGGLRHAGILVLVDRAENDGGPVRAADREVLLQLGLPVLEVERIDQGAAAHELQGRLEGGPGVAVDTEGQRNLRHHFPHNGRKILRCVPPRLIGANVQDVASLAHLGFPHSDHPVHISGKKGLPELLGPEDVRTFPYDEAGRVLHHRDGGVQTGESRHKLRMPLARRPRSTAQYRRS